MNQQKSESSPDRWTTYYVLMMQRAAEREIEEAIRKVKSDVPTRKRAWPRRRRKRGYWTPVGFAWFKRKGRWHNNKGQNSNCRLSNGVR
jgi:hypothetical protein